MVSLQVPVHLANGADGDWQTKRDTIRERNEFMFNNPMLSDITFIFNEPNGKVKTIPAHKYVLAISSPVFFSMFYSELAERNDTIDITDCDSESFLEMLRYIYSDEVNLSNCGGAVDLWYSAQKYIIPSLVKKCVAYLDENVGVNDVLDVLPYAVKFDDEALQATCWKIIDFHARTIMESEAFLGIDRELLVAMLERNSLRVVELELFRSIDRWARRKCEERNIEQTGENKREVIGADLLRLVRFPVLKQEDFAQKVLPTNLLTNQQAVDIFKHFSSVIDENFRFAAEPRQNYSEVTRAHRFDSASHGWSYQNTQISDALVMSVSIPIKLCGFSFFGTHESEYTVTLNVFENEEPSKAIAKCSGTFATNRPLTMSDETAARCFDCLFRSPVDLMAYREYTIRAFIRGPDSYFGSRSSDTTSENQNNNSRGQYSQFQSKSRAPTSHTLHCEGVPFTFSNVNNAGRTTFSKGQIPTVIFMA